MPRALRELKAEAFELPVESRGELAEALLDSLEPSDAEIQERWKTGVDDRRDSLLLTARTADDEGYSCFAVVKDAEDHAGVARIRGPKRYRASCPMRTSQMRASGRWVCRSRAAEMVFSAISCWPVSRSMATTSPR